MEEHETMSSLRERRKKPSVGISCCFSGTTKHRRRASLDAATASPIPHHPSPRLMSPSTWIKSRTNDFPEIKGKCRNFMSRMGRHRRHASADFSYDPLSYSLNFDDDAASSSEDFQAINNFSARLPVSPPRRTDHHLPRTLVHMEEVAEDRAAGGTNDELRRGFEALSLSMKTRGGNVVEAGRERRNKSASTVEVEAEEVVSPVGISSNSYSN